MPLSTSHIEDTLASREESVKKLLPGILNLNLQHESTEKCIVTIINRLLSTARHRKEGLEYLNLVIDNCSPSLITENALNWTSHCIIKFADDILRELKLGILGQIIKVAHNESDFNKKFVSDYISKVLDNCTTTSRVNPYECKAALRALTISMQYYSSWFGPHRQKIENFLLIFLDSENADLVQNAALAFHFLQQVGSAGPNGVNHKLNFTQNFRKLCKTVHKLYDIFFENERELFHTERTNDESIFEFQDDPSINSQALLHVNARRIRNVLKFIETMIKTKFPVAKETKPKELLEVITRGTSIHKCISGDKIESLETYQFSFLLSEIQCAVLKLLRLFIIWYQSNCLPFSYSISKTLVDSIERSHNCECFKYDSLYRESSYRALSEWLTVSKSSLHTQFQSQILTCILKDITPIKTQITLTISEAVSGKKSQKAKRKAMTERIISSGNQSFSDDSTPHEKNNEQNTCKFALTALRHLLELTRLNVKPALLKDLYKSIFESLTTIQSSKPIHPYTDAHCQAKLYEVLVAIYNQNTLTILPPLQTSLDILTRGANDSNRFVSEICHAGLRNLEILCQPICPSMYLGVEKEEEEMEEERAVSEVIEIEEMDVDEEGGGDEAVSSVDFDASTDEYSPNVTHTQNTSLAASVNQPDTDTSLNDERLSAEDTSTEEFISSTSAKQGEVNQPDNDLRSDDELNNQDGDGCKVEVKELETGHEGGETDVALGSNIIALSEDENQDKSEEEVDQPDSPSGFQQEQDKVSSNIEELQNQEKSDAENSTKEVVEIDVEEIDENATEQDGDQEQELKNEKNEVVIPNSKETENEEQEPSVAEIEIAAEHHEKFTKETEIRNEQNVTVDSTKSQIDSDEPPSKKAKLTSEDDELGDGEAGTKGSEKKEEKDRDSVDLEDDSFVDEVKDYY